MVANKLDARAEVRPKMMPKVYFDSNLKIRYMPAMMIKPTMTSGARMHCFFIRGSKIAVKRVKEERHTSVTDTVETLMA
jgi:hypothetical protein